MEPPGSGPPDSTAKDAEAVRTTVVHSIVQWFVTQSVYVLGAIIFAYLYRTNKEWFLGQELVKSSEKDYTRWTSPAVEPILFWSCFCPAVRWADSMSMAKVLPTYWQAFFLYIGISVIGSAAFGLPGWLLMTCFLTIFRIRLRSRFDMEQSTCIDFCCLCWCLGCVVAQEARHVEDASLAGRMPEP